MSAVKAYKRSPALPNSWWYKGMLMSQMAGTAGNNVAFDVIIAQARQGTEPPPHVHSREDEFMYLLPGETKAYVDAEVFTVTAGKCMFLPRQEPHAFRIVSDEIHMLLVIILGRFHDATNTMNASAKRMKVPTDADTMTDANVDLTETIKVLEQYGIRFLSPDETRAHMPEYPL
jgi:quercetin dioxygenase-like cupin family protein